MIYPVALGLVTISLAAFGFCLWCICRIASDDKYPEQFDLTRGWDDFNALDQDEQGT